MSQHETRKDHQPVSPELFRDVIRHLASGVTIITSAAKGGPVGLTATAVCSISAKPPMLLVSLSNTSHTVEGVEQSGAFPVHLLGHAEKVYDAMLSYSTTRTCN